MELLYTKTRDVKNPERGYKYDAGIDFFVPNDFEPTVVEPFDDIFIESGIKVVIPEGYTMILKEKSGICTKKKLVMGASVIDSGYRGVMYFHMFNSGSRSTTIEPGDKIVQGVLLQIPESTFTEISNEEYSKYVSDRGDKGFGSTGYK